MTGISEAITAVAVLLPTIGGGVVWFFAHVEKRVRTAEKKADECEEHRTSDRETINRLTFDVRRDGLAVRMLFNELHRIDPKSAELVRVGNLLRSKYQPDMNIPDDWQDLLDRLDKVA